MSDDYRLLQVKDAAEQLGMTSAAMAAVIEAGQIRAVRIGVRWRVPASALAEYEEWRAAADAPPPLELEDEFKPGRHAIPLKVRFAVLKRCQFACSYCGRRPPEVALQVDHIVAVANGGTNRPSNLTAACWECNIGKRTQTVDLEVDE